MASLIRYDTYLLNDGVHQHFFNSKGIDVYSHFSDAGDPDFLESYYSVRLMRQLYAVRPMSLQQWKLASERLGRANSFLFTHDALLEPKRPPDGSDVMQPKGRQSGYRRSADGYSLASHLLLQT